MTKSPERSLSPLYAEVSVSVNHPDLDRTFFYRVPDEMAGAAQRGMRAAVPFGTGNRRVEGFIVNVTDNPEYVPENIKPIEKLLDNEPVFTEEMLKLARWMRDKYYACLSECLICIMPSGIQMKSGGFFLRKTRYLRLSGECGADFKLTGPQKKVCDLLAECGEMERGDAKARAGVSDSPIDSLIKKHYVLMEEREEKRKTAQLPPDMYPETRPPDLTTEQSEAVERLVSALNGKKPKPALLMGVTGSGKTEVYLHLIEHVLNAGKQAIMLVPEISLTPQTVEAFVKRLGGRVSVTHSRLTNAERYEQWARAKSGETMVMIGPRSAVFAPFERLGAIIVDEEHEGAYKSEITPKYSAKEIAVWRASYSGALCVFGTATPSLESYHKAEEGEIDLIRLTERINKTLPEVNIIDMRRELAMGNPSVFSTELGNALRDNAAAGRQSILFLNRRGHSTFVSCRKCGYVMKCANCNVNYTYHSHGENLCCHYCGAKTVNPSNCPACGSKFLKYFGVGTQKVEQELCGLIPEARVFRMDMDTTSGKNSHKELIDAFSGTDGAVLLGTQMIAKGLDFPFVSLVGIISADISLHNGDFRAGETTFQLLTQVSGRAGRASFPGKVFIQTYNPEHYSVRYAKDQDYESFYRHEITLRRQMDYPPFTHVFSIMFTGTDEKYIIKSLYTLLKIMNYCDKQENFEVLGPAPAVVSKINRQFRWKLLIKSAEEDKLKRFAVYCARKLREHDPLKEISVHMTMDPVFLE